MYTQDLYKFTMINAVIQRFGLNHTGKFRFKCRGKEKIGILADAVRSRFVQYGKTVCPYNLTQKTVSFLESLGINLFVLSVLRNQDFSDVVFTCENRNDDLFIEVSGPIQKITFFEIPVLACVQEEWSRHNGWLDNNYLYRQGIANLFKKVEDFNSLNIKNFFVIEMGTRRAFSNTWLKYVISHLAWNLNSFAGTSNVGMAMDLNVACKGTMAHEYLQMGQVLTTSIHETNKFMLNAWVQTYGNKFGIALSDCLTSNQFCKEFDIGLANSFTGTRQDSGNPFEYGDKIYQHYKNLGIDPLTKDIIFSDSLDFNKASSVVGYFCDKFRSVGLGIGTFFSHDLGVEPLKIVMKLVEFDGKPVIKISDDVGKTMSVNSEYEAHVRKELKI